MRCVCSCRSVLRSLLGIALIIGVGSNLVYGNDFFESWESLPPGFVQPSSVGLFDAEAGTWIAGDTVSEFPECGPTPHTGEIVSSSTGGRALRLTSNDSRSSCSDNLWIEFREFLPLNVNPGFSVPIDTNSVLSFEATGSLVNPGPIRRPTCIQPPCGDNITLFVQDNRGFLLAYVLQRAPGQSPHSIAGRYQEIFLDPSAGLYSRNLLDDFKTISGYNPEGARVDVINFQIDEHGSAIIDNISIGVNPQASFTFFPNHPTVREVITFDGSASNDPNGEIVSYLWEFGDGNNATGQKATHSYALHGEYTVTLTVKDNDGLTDSVTQSVTVLASPVAAFTFSPTRITVREAIMFDSSASSDADGEIVSYSWNFGGGQNLRIRAVNRSYAEAGEYAVTLTVTDNDGLSDSVTQSVTVLPAVSGDFGDPCDEVSSCRQCLKCDAAMNVCVFDNNQLVPSTNPCETYRCLGGIVVGPECNQRVAPQNSDEDCLQEFCNGCRLISLLNLNERGCKGCLFDPLDLVKGDCKKPECRDGKLELTQDPTDRVPSKECPDPTCCIGKCTSTAQSICDCRLCGPDGIFDVIIIAPRDVRGGTLELQPNILSDQTIPGGLIITPIPALQFPSLIPPGSYMAFLVPPLATYLAPAHSTLEVPIDASKIVTIAFDVVGGFRASGRISSSSGELIYEVTLRPVNLANGVSPFDGFLLPRTDSNGGFSFVIQAGTYNVILTPPPDSGLVTKTITVSGTPGETIDLGVIPLEIE